MKLTVFSSDGTTSSEQEFAGLPVFEGDKGLQAVKEVIVAINANNRQGTHSTKTRGEVRGGGKKPWRQKGTGRARAGSIRSPLWVGGGVVFGPKPRDYSKKINAKVKALAFSRALFDRATAGDLDVIIIDGEHRLECAKAARSRLRHDGLMILDNSDWFERTAEFLRGTDLIEVDMSGFGPINGYTWTTSFFLTRNVNLKSLGPRQPMPGIGSLPHREK